MRDHEKQPRRSDALGARLSRLPHRLQVPFAAPSAARPLPLRECEAHAGAPALLPAFRAAVEAVWAAALDPDVPPEQLAAASEAVETVFPEGDHYSGYHVTLSAGAAILSAVDAVGDPSGRAVANVALHVSSAYETATDWDEEPTDDMEWQEQAVDLLERWGERPVERESFASLPPAPELGTG